MKTRAAILYKLNSPLKIKEVEIPPLKKGQVLVKILCSGICRAQLNEITGLKGPDRYLPHMLGHEGSGIIEAIGSGVRKVKRGDYVILSWIKGNGLDAFGAQYRMNGKFINAGSVTVFSDYSVVSENRVTKISKKVPPDIAAVIGCAVATGAGIINNTLKVKKGDSVAVWGLGGVGLSVILAARQKRCSKIIAVDIASQKLTFAKKMGATHLIDGRTNVLAKIQNICKAGVDYAVDASGAKIAMEQAFEAIKNSGILVIAGNLSKQEKISIHPFELIKGKRIIGTWGGETIPDRDFPKYARDYCSGKLPIDRLITHRFKFEDINKAFAVFKKGETGRIVLKNSGR